MERYSRVISIVNTVPDKTVQGESKDYVKYFIASLCLEEYNIKTCIILHYNMYYFHFTLQEPC